MTIDWLRQKHEQALCVF